MYKNLFTLKSILSKFVILIITVTVNTTAVLASDVEALKAQRQAVTEHLRNGQISQAEAALAELKQNYSSLPEYAKEFHELGWEFLKRGHYATALQMYQDLLQQFPNHQRTAWFQRSIARTYLEQGDMEKAAQAVETMFSDYSSKPEFVRHAHELGWKFIVKGQYATALRIYEGLQQQFGDHERAAWFQRSIVQTYLAQGDTTKALEAVEQMKNNFQSHPDYENQMERLVVKLVENGQPEAARGVCETLLKKFPNHSRMPWILQGKARSEAWMKRQDLADATVEVMQQKCASHPDYADALSWTAYEYRKAGLYQRAIELYESVLALDADKKVHLRSVAGIAQSYARLGNSTQMQAKVDYLLSNFGDNPQGIVFYLFGIVEEYYHMSQEDEEEANAKSHIQKAIQLAELRLNTYPNVEVPSIEADFYNCLGDCYRRTGQYQKAIDCFEKFLTSYSDNDLAWHVQFQIGRCYEKMSELGAFDKSQAKEKAKLAYQKLLERYPDCKAAQAAQSWLDKN